MELDDTVKEFNQLIDAHRAKLHYFKSTHQRQAFRKHAKLMQQLILDFIEEYADLLELNPKVEASLLVTHLAPTPVLASTLLPEATPTLNETLPAATALGTTYVDDARAIEDKSFDNFTSPGCCHMS